MACLSSLDYEPHTNLSINTKTADECRNLSDIRYEIDTIDHFIIKLMRDRMQYVLAASKFKLNVKAIADNGRIIQQLNWRKKWAGEYGLDPEYIQSFFKQMIDWYISQQIAYYKNRNPDEKTIEIKLHSLNELKLIEFGLNWINIAQYGHLLRAGYKKAMRIGEPVLISFSQKTSMFADNDNLTNVTPFNLFEQSRRHSLSHAFIFVQPSKQFLMLALGNTQQFDINQTISPFNSMTKKVADFTYQEFQSEVKRIVDDGWKHLLLNAIIENAAGNNFLGQGPVLSGGLCFDHRNTYRSRKWSNFSEASFFLPQIQFIQQGANVYATFNTVITEYDKSKCETEFIDDKISSLLKFCNEFINGANEHSNNNCHSVPFSHNISEITQECRVSPETWKQTVRDALVHITNGDFEKVVLAREDQIQAGQEKVTVNVEWSLRRLSSLYPSSYIFGVLRQGSCFFGATPEQLVQLHHSQLKSTALAGTIRRDTNEVEDKALEIELFNSGKQRHEHNLVVELVKSKLEPITETNSLEISNEPLLLKLASLQHLYTPIQGTIVKGVTILDVVQILHPTPAVGGLPQSDALRFIRENENLDRGWYGAPIGWMDANNNGEFVVALRSALVNDTSISLFAGCGIVAGSEPEDEFLETQLKMKTMLLALGEQKVV